MDAMKNIPLDGALPIAAFILIGIGACAKAGTFGFHNWIVDAAGTNPSTTMAFLPASLDKFLGIYLFVKTMAVFFNTEGPLKIIFMAIGALTILLAVFMALVQHDLKKLLAYHAVSQVGYMVLGIATGTVIGIAGGMFHMLNHTIYKSSLFLNAGNLEYRIGKTGLNELGGLAKNMPVTFIATLIAALSISGVPPLNGFVSKWFIYQSLLEKGSLSGARVAFLIIAVFGSALTLASFGKVLYSVFFAEGNAETKRAKEVPFSMIIPIALLSILCVAFGVFANALVVKPFLKPIISGSIAPLGVWQPGIATALLLFGLAIGFVIYLISKPSGRTVEPFMGGEDLGSNKVLGTEFYLAVEKDSVFSFVYRMNEKGCFDFYRIVKNSVKYTAYVAYYAVDRVLNSITDGVGKLTFVASGVFKGLHTGLLDRYLAWILIGFAVIIGVFFKCLSSM